MPNIVGGDQHHPSYDPRTKVEENQVLEGTCLYTVVKLEKGYYVTSQDVTELSPSITSWYPDSVKQKIEEICSSTSKR